MKRIISLVIADFRVIRRDSMFFMSILAPFIIATVMWAGLPLLTNLLIDKLSFDLTKYYVVIMGFVVVLVPFILGILSGLLLLDEKDENILSYIAVTPLPKERYVIYKMLIAIMVSAVLTLMTAIVMPINDVNIFKVIPVVIMSSLEAPMLSLFMVGFAGNKIEGLAYSKGIGFVLFVPVAAYFLNAQWSIILGVFPTYWVAKALFESFESSNSYFLYIIGGITVHGVYLFFLQRKFTRG